MKYRVQLNNRVFEVEVGDVHARPVTATVDGETFEVWPEESVAAPAAPSPEPVRATPATATAPAATNGDSATGITAPIPGVIVEIKVVTGDQVKAGQPVCVLEAMKMKNVICAPRDGRIGVIHMVEGKQVKHRDLLMDYQNA